MAKKKEVKQEAQDADVLDQAIAQADLDPTPVAPQGGVQAIERIQVKAPITKRSLQKKGRLAGLGPVKIQSPKKESNELTADDRRLVEVIVDEELHINGQRLYGRLVMEAHEARSIIPMLQAKKRADIEVHTGHNFLIKRDLASNTLMIRELGGDDE